MEEHCGHQVGKGTSCNLAVGAKKFATSFMSSVIRLERFHHDTQKWRRYENCVERCGYFFKIGNTVSFLPNHCA